VSPETVPARPEEHVRAAGGELRQLADDYVDDLARRHPDTATELGDHRFDGLLPDRSQQALADERRRLDAFADQVTALDLTALSKELRVDAALLAGDVSRRLFEIEELREHTWNPLLANPGQAIYMLLARDYAPLSQRLAAVAGRLAGVPDALAAARAALELMPQVHLETAIAQFDGAIDLVTGEIDGALGRAGDARVIAEVERARPAAVEALTAHRDWLTTRLAEAAGHGVGDHGVGDHGAGDHGFADPRIGADLFTRKLSLTLSAAADSDAILARAEADLERLTEEITRVAAGLGGTPREVLDRLGGAAPDEATILAFCADALRAQTVFVADHDLITLHDDPVELIDMPEVNRGISVAYCDPPGPLETTPLPTFIAVSPTPQDWPAERVASFYREYNRHMVHNLMVHEAMPGHYLQLQHSRRFTGATALRTALWSGSFVEGWAVYAEELMVNHGYPGEGDPAALHMQQLKMQLRMVINAILDARVHAHGMTEEEAMALMTGPGFQEEGEAAGKWRRALLTSAQLSTYYVGYTEISDLAAELSRTGRAPRAVHDSMLAHGSPPVRLLRTLV
jgi:uncharacterized protein (DUF885 family)